MQKLFLNNININQLSSTTAPYETECVCMWFSIRIDTYMIKNSFKCHVLRLRHNDFLGKMFCVYYYLIILPDQFCVSKFLPSQLYTIIASSFYFFSRFFVSKMLWSNKVDINDFCRNEIWGKLFLNFSSRDVY